MNRLPRSSAKIQPPLRGRLATVLSPQQRQQYAEPIIRSRPSLPRSIKARNEQNRVKEDYQPNSLEPETINIDERDALTTDSGDRRITNQEPAQSPTSSQNETGRLLLALIIIFLFLLLLKYLL